MKGEDSACIEITIFCNAIMIPGCMMMTVFSVQLSGPNHRPMVNMSRLEYVATLRCCRGSLTPFARWFQEYVYAAMLITLQTDYDVIYDVSLLMLLTCNQQCIERRRIAQN